VRDSRIDLQPPVDGCKFQWHNQTRAPERSVILMGETATIVPTGT
jgi:hypothetical protein